MKMLPAIQSIDKGSENDWMHEEADKKKQIKLLKLCHLYGHAASGHLKM